MCEAHYCKAWMLSSDMRFRRSECTNDWCENDLSTDASEGLIEKTVRATFASKGTDRAIVFQYSQGEGHGLGMHKVPVRVTHIPISSRRFGRKESSCPALFKMARKFVGTIAFSLSRSSGVHVVKSVSGASALAMKYTGDWKCLPHLCWGTKVLITLNIISTLMGPNFVGQVHGTC